VLQEARGQPPPQARSPNCHLIVTYLFLVFATRRARLGPTIALPMKRFDKINYGFRPNSYWEARSPLLEILKNVQGAIRRKIIQERWDAGTIDGLVDDLLVDTLSDEQREDLAQIHPSFRGGEFLPPYAAQELEIARIELQSSTWDVISIRARRTDDIIFYSICDEYASQFELCLPLSYVPLTLGELIKLIDHAGEQESLGLDFTLEQFPPEDGEELDEVKDFCAVTSLFYPDLARHYEKLVDWRYSGQFRSF
jgi:hypothetical protein